MQRMKSLECEACGSRSFIREGNSTFKCDYCGARYILGEERQEGLGEFSDSSMPHCRVCDSPEDIRKCDACGRVACAKHRVQLSALVPPIVLSRTRNLTICTVCGSEIQERVRESVRRVLSFEPAGVRAPEDRRVQVGVLVGLAAVFVIIAVIWHSLGAVVAGLIPLAAVRPLRKRGEKERREYNRLIERERKGRERALNECVSLLEGTIRRLSGHDDNGAADYGESAGQ